MRKSVPSMSAKATLSRPAKGWSGGTAMKSDSTIRRVLTMTGKRNGLREMPKSMAPESTRCSTSRSVMVSEDSTSPGKRSTMRAVRFHKGAGAQVPTLRARARRHSASTASRNFCASSSTARPRSATTCPSVFMVARLRPRSNSSAPSSASKRWTERLSAGWESESTSAAADMVPASSMAIICRSWSSSIGTSLAFPQSIIGDEAAPIGSCPVSSVLAPPLCIWRIASFSMGIVHRPSTPSQWDSFKQAMRQEEGTE